MVCTVCGSVGFPKKVTPGSFLVELGLWIFFILPGVIYSVWRLSALWWRPKPIPVLDPRCHKGGPVGCALSVRAYLAIQVSMSESARLRCLRRLCLRSRRVLGMTDSAAYAASSAFVASAMTRGIGRSPPS